MTPFSSAFVPQGFFSPEYGVSGVCENFSHILISPPFCSLSAEEECE